jgi:hypothetical protein
MIMEVGIEAGAEAVEEADGPHGGAWARRGRTGARAHEEKRGPPDGLPSRPCAWRYRTGRPPGPCRRKPP